MNNLLPTILIVLAFLGCSCDSTEPPTNEKKIRLTEIDVSVTEAYLHVKINNPSPSREIILLRNGNEILRFASTNSDTIITDTSLTELTSYNYMAQLVENGTVVGVSNNIILNTLKRTSNNFIWTELEYEGDKSSLLYDVAFLNDTEVLAVGEFYLEGEVRVYGFLRWDGTTLNPFRLFASLPPAGAQINLRPTGILVISETDIWFAGGSVYHWDDGSVTPYWLSNFQGNPDPLFQQGQFARKIWGNKEINEIYVGGDNGALALFRDGIWESINPNVENNIIDISGYRSKITGNIEVLCATTSFSSIDNKLLKINNSNNVSQIDWDINNIVKTTWANFDMPMFVGGRKIYTNKNGNWNEQELFDNSILTKIRGNSLNNIFALGPQNAMLHFNGINWAKINLPSNNDDIFWNSIFIDGNRILLGGNSLNNGIKILVGEMIE